MKENIHPNVSLEQWRTLMAVVDHGGYGNAAEILEKSQSTVSHNIQRLEELLGTQVLKIQGRKAVLTAAGKLALRRARTMLDEAADIEHMARTVASGVESEVGISVDAIFPNQILLPAICEVSRRYENTRLELYETVLSGSVELLHQRKVKIAISASVPQGWLADPLIELEMVCVAHPDHPLHQIDRPVTREDLSQHRQIVVRDSGTLRNRDGGWLGSEQRLTVSNMSTRIQALCQGLGFAWQPLLKLESEMQSQQLKPLRLEKGSSRFVTLYMVIADEGGAGPVTREMAKQIEQQVKLKCREHSS